MATKFLIGIDLGGTNLKIGLIDLKYKIRNKEVLNTRSFNTKGKLISAIVRSIDKILNDNEIKKSNILGVGLGLPGPIDAAAGLVHFFPNIPGWKNVRLKGILQAELKLPVFLDNDANLMCLAESRLGAAKGLKNVICLTLGTGVGGGIVIDGKLYRGSSFSAGEAGHIPINEAGPRCNCGGIACLERYIGNKRIMKRARGIFNRNISLEELSRLAKNKNKKAQAIWNEVGMHLGVVLSGAVNLLNPDAIIIGGGVAQAGKGLFDKIKAVILKRAMDVPAGHVKILKARLGNDAGLIGAAILAGEGV